MSTENKRLHQLMIFCDGGIGNRINSLISGLAIARIFDLQHCIYWPENNWCQAGFTDIFKNKMDFKNSSLTDLKGTLGNSVAMLHDEIASKNLGINFNSAYQYASLEDFADKVLNEKKEIFYYPAVIPDWIPFGNVVAELKKLSFSDHIENSVQSFITNTIQRPFHGLHLRRTDLNVGLNDHEVLNLVLRNPGETFFVCSDDPIAESLACVHPNVYARPKMNTVTKKFDEKSWLDETSDDDGRIYFGNILRSKDAVIEGVIDLLVLAHSQIVGYSGSTFQKMARLVGESCPLVQIEKPNQLNYFSPTEIQRQTQAKLLSSELLISLSNKIGTQGDMQEAIALLQNGCAQFEGGDYLDIIHTLGIFFLNQNQPKIARLYLSDVVSNDSNRYSSWLHLAYSNFLCSDFEKLKENLIQLGQCNQQASSISDAQLLDYLTQKTQNIF